MKVVYLDQNQWIELSRAAHGATSRAETATVLDAVRKSQASGQACFPLSLAHCMETVKQHAAERRARLASFMLELSGGMMLAPPGVVVHHEIEEALARCFPGRVEQRPFRFLGRGLSHAADKNLGFHLEWPEANDIPARRRTAFEEQVAVMVEHSLLSAVLPTGAPLDRERATDLSSDRQFKAGLAEWRGAASRYSPDELERRVYATSLRDIHEVLWRILASYNIPIEDFALLGEHQWRAFLDDMPSCRAQMHLLRQWAKNATLTPKDSDLNDWAFLTVAISYCDVVVTEKQVADLFFRGLRTRATIVARLARLPELVA